LYECARCGFQASVTAGTIFQDTKKPLRLWFRAIWHLTGQKYGANALGLQRILDLGSYRTAWTWLHKLRRAMVRPGRDRLREPAPLRGDPYAVFGHYATRLIDDRTPIRTAVPSPLKALDRLGALKMNNYARAMLLPAQDIQSLVRRVREAGELRVGDLFEGIAPERRPAMRRTVGWLAKLGIVKSAE